MGQTNPAKGPGSIVVGIDFDNTIVNYDQVMVETALERNLIKPGDASIKNEVRERVRSLINGEIEWQKLQAEVYGPRMAHAQANDGVRRFVTGCIELGWTTYIISHKTQFATQDETRTDLRALALTWLETQEFLGEAERAIPKENVFFEASRGEKISRIKTLECTHFIDDLDETFLDETFPQEVQKILYSPGAPERAVPDTLTAESWDQITSHLFDGHL